jgi:hypothetical protein
MAVASGLAALFGRGAGLCGSCASAREITSSRGSSFLLCQRSATDNRYTRYPRQPVLDCRGYEPDGGGEDGTIEGISRSR